MRPIDIAWQLLKNYTKPSPVMLPELGETDVERNPPISQYLKDNNEHYRMGHRGSHMGYMGSEHFSDDEKHDFDNQRMNLFLANMFTSQPPYARQANPPTLDTGMGELTTEEVEQYYGRDFSDLQA